MGLIRMGPPEALVALLARKFDIQVFIETGTYHGHTAAWAASRFHEVYTIEKSPELSAKAAARLLNHGNIRVLNSDSPNALRDLAEQITVSCLFWLDAHWSGGTTSGLEQQCPLLDEIAAVRMFAQPKVVLIDDARLFLSTPQPPHDPHQWPEISEVFSALNKSLPDNYLAIIEDVIVCVPGPLGDVVREYCRDVNTLAWQAYGERLNKERLDQRLQTKLWPRLLKHIMGR